MVTIYNCRTSQFSQHLGTIVGAPEAAPIGEEEIEEKGADEDWGFLEPFDPEAEADPEIVLFG